MPREPSKKDSRGWKSRLEDMVGAIHAILDYSAEMTFEQFATDRRTVHAVLHNFAILGEAARHVPQEVEEAHSDLPWSEMRKMRNIAVHVYHGIELTTLWQTIAADLPSLLPQLEAMLAERDVLGENDR